MFVTGSAFGPRVCGPVHLMVCGPWQWQIDDFMVGEDEYRTLPLILKYSTYWWGLTPFWIHHWSVQWSAGDSYQYTTGVYVRV